jgi:hypothetical protein
MALPRIRGGQAHCRRTGRRVRIGITDILYNFDHNQADAFR